MRRGLTVIEMMLAVGLLSTLTVAIASWVQVTVRATADSAGPARWRAAATAVLQLVHEDIVIGDLSTERGVRRVTMDSGELMILTRSVEPDDPRGPVRHRYRFDASTGRLERRTTAVGTSRRQPRPLLDDVAEFRPEIDVVRGRLIITLTSTGGRSLVRSYTLP